MADDTRLPIGTQDGDTYRSDENVGLPGNPKTQVIKIELGDDGAFDGFVSSTNPLPISGLITVSGVLGTVTTQERAASVATRSQYTGTADAQILASSATRRRVFFYNDGDQDLLLGEGTTVVTTTNFTARLKPGGIFAADDTTASFRGLFVAALGSGSLMVTESTY